MQITGRRLLIKRLPVEDKEGFQTVDVEDTFLNKGIVEQVGDGTMATYSNGLSSPYLGKTILFAKYSPDTHDYEDMKIINVDDVLAIL